MMKERLSLGLAMILMFCVGLAQATPVAITNPSFETPVLEDTSDGYYTTDAHGWNISGPGATYIVRAGYQSYDYLSTPLPDGVNALVMQTKGGDPMQRDQSIGTMQAGQEYTASASVAHLSGLAGCGYLLALIDTTAGEYLGGVTNVASWQTTYGLDAGANPTTGSWTQVSFTTTVSQDRDGHGLLIALISGPTSTDSLVSFDDVSVDVIPEPATMGLLLIGGGLLGIRRRRRLRIV